MTKEIGMDDMQGLDGLVRTDLARRGFVMTTLISGLTLATSRVEAQVITTDSEGIIAGEVMIQTADGFLPGYFAKPEGFGTFPIVIVNEEVFGIHAYIKDVMRRLAKAGYAAVAVEIYARAGDLTKMTNPAEITRDVVLKTPDATVMSDNDAALAYAVAHGGNPNRIAVTGFCRGGRTTWLYAAHNPQVKAAVAWYGPIGGTTTAIQPKTVATMAGDIQAPLLGLYGGKDSGIPVEAVQAAAATARAAGKKVEIIIYPEAPHGFHADYRPSYRAEAALDGWSRMLAWFKAAGV